MKYYSLNDNKNTASFSEAVIRGLAPDRGLYFPQSTPRLDESFITEIANKSMVEIGVEVMRTFVGGTIPDARLEKIVTDTLCFDFPLIKINDNTATLELFHGPSMAFKDVGARFMARCIGYFNEQSCKKVTVLVATSGDTGGAVASGFLGIGGTEVIILYPKGKVSQIQELQLTTNGNNIKAVEVDGVFDDCQEMVKSAFIDDELKVKLNLTSANSINVARWLPQSLYFFFAYQQFQHMRINKNLAISVPSGNFGNLCAGLMAQQMGLPIKHFVASTNVNDTVPSYLSSGNYEPKKSISTISNAMDVGDPSNFIRIQKLFNNDFYKLKKVVSGFAYTDSQTKKALKEIYKSSNYIADPHGAVSYLGLKDYLNSQEQDTLQGIFFETAHPIKFAPTVETILKLKIDPPKQVESLLNKPKLSLPVNDYKALKDFFFER